jgi:hypothetical protein
VDRAAARRNADGLATLAARPLLNLPAVYELAERAGGPGARATCGWRRYGSCCRRRW